LYTGGCVQIYGFGELLPELLKIIPALLGQIPAIHQINVEAITSGDFIGFALWIIFGESTKDCHLWRLDVGCGLEIGLELIIRKLLGSLAVLEVEGIPIPSGPLHFFGCGS
jgi:hypothetical protein